MGDAVVSAVRDVGLAVRAASAPLARLRQALGASATGGCLSGAAAQSAAALSLAWLDLLERLLVLHATDVASLSYDELRALVGGITAVSSLPAAFHHTFEALMIAGTGFGAPLVVRRRYDGRRGMPLHLLPVTPSVGGDGAAAVAAQLSGVRTGARVNDDGSEIGDDETIAVTMPAAGDADANARVLRGFFIAAITMVHGHAEPGLLAYPFHSATAKQLKLDAVAAIAALRRFEDAISQYDTRIATRIRTSHFASLRAALIHAFPAQLADEDRLARDAQARRLADMRVSLDFHTMKAPQPYVWEVRGRDRAHVVIGGLRFQVDTGCGAPAVVPASMVPPAALRRPRNGADPPHVITGAGAVPVLGVAVVGAGGARVDALIVPDDTLPCLIGTRALLAIFGGAAAIGVDDNDNVVIEPLAGRLIDIGAGQCVLRPTYAAAAADSVAARVIRQSASLSDLTDTAVSWPERIAVGLAACARAMRAMVDDTISDAECDAILTALSSPAHRWIAAFVLGRNDGYWPYTNVRAPRVHLRTLPGVTHDQLNAASAPARRRQRSFEQWAVDVSRRSYAEGVAKGIWDPVDAPGVPPVAVWSRVLYCLKGKGGDSGGTDAGDDADVAGAADAASPSPGDVRHVFSTSRLSQLTASEPCLLPDTADVARAVSAWHMTHEVDAKGHHHQFLLADDASRALAGVVTAHGRAAVLRTLAPGMRQAMPAAHTHMANAVARHGGVSYADQAFVRADASAAGGRDLRSIAAEAVRVLGIFAAAGITINIDKTRLFATTVDVTGYEVSYGRVRAMRRRRHILDTDARPTTTAAAAQLLHCIQSLDNVLPNCAALLAPLRAAIGAPGALQWTPVLESWWQRARLALHGSLPLAAWRPSLRTAIATDWRVAGQAVMLFQTTAAELRWATETRRFPRSLALLTFRSRTLRGSAAASANRPTAVGEATTLAFGTQLEAATLQRAYCAHGPVTWFYDSVGAVGAAVGPATQLVNPAIATAHATITDLGIVYAPVLLPRSENRLADFGASFSESQFIASAPDAPPRGDPQLFDTFTLDRSSGDASGAAEPPTATAAAAGTDADRDGGAATAVHWIANCDPLPRQNQQSSFLLGWSGVAGGEHERAPDKRADDGDGEDADDATAYGVRPRDADEDSDNTDNDGDDDAGGHDTGAATDDGDLADAQPTGDDRFDAARLWRLGSLRRSGVNAAALAAATSTDKAAKDVYARLVRGAPVTTKLCGGMPFVDTSVGPPLLRVQLGTGVADGDDTPCAPLYIPQSLRRPILSAAHADHTADAKMYRMWGREVIWQRLKADLRDAHQQCVDCQRTARKHARKDAGVGDMTGARFESYQFDTHGPFTIRFDDTVADAYVLTGIDVCTGVGTSILVRSKSDADLSHYVLTRFILPYRLRRASGDAAFGTEAMRALWDEHGVSFTPTAPHDPNGGRSYVERRFGSMDSFLAKVLNVAAPIDWRAAEVALAEFDANMSHAVCTSRGTTPFALATGQRAPSQLDIALGTRPTAAIDLSTAALRALDDAADAVCAAATQAALDATARRHARSQAAADRANAGRRARPLDAKPGDLVWVEAAFNGAGKLAGKLYSWTVARVVATPRRTADAAESKTLLTVELPGMPEFGKFDVSTRQVRMCRYMPKPRGADDDRSHDADWQNGRLLPLYLLPVRAQKKLQKLSVAELAERGLAPLPPGARPPQRSGRLAKQRLEERTAMAARIAELVARIDEPQRTSGADNNEPEQQQQEAAHVEDDDDDGSDDDKNSSSSSAGETTPAKTEKTKKEKKKKNATPQQKTTKGDKLAAKTKTKSGVATKATKEKKKNGKQEKRTESAAGATAPHAPSAATGGVSIDVPPQREQPQQPAGSPARTGRQQQQPPQQPQQQPQQAAQAPSSGPHTPPASPRVPRAPPPTPASPQRPTAPSPQPPRHGYSLRDRSNIKPPNVFVAYMRAVRNVRVLPIHAISVTKHTLVNGKLMYEINGDSERDSWCALVPYSPAIHRYVHAYWQSKRARGANSALIS